MSTDACARVSSAAARAVTAPTTLRFCGIADEPPPLAALAHLSDLRLREQEDDRAPIFARTPASDLEGRAELGDSDAVRVPGQRRLGEIELEGVQARDLGPVLAERSERPGGTARAGPRGSCRGAATSRARASSSGDEPAGSLEPERRRHGLLEQRATGHRRVAVVSGRAPRTPPRRGRPRRARGRARGA